MLLLAFAVTFLTAQLSGPGSRLPQILHPEFKLTAPLHAGERGDILVSFTALKGYSVDRTLPLTLTLTPTAGLTFAKTDLAASGKDPKSKDQYYVDLPEIKASVTAERAGKYEVPAKLKYFFCSKADGFCSFQVLDVKIPINVN